MVASIFVDRLPLDLLTEDQPPATGTVSEEFSEFGKGKVPIRLRQREERLYLRLLLVYEALLRIAGADFFTMLRISERRGGTDQEYLLAALRAPTIRECAQQDLSI